MKKTVLITVKGTQVNELGEKDNVELTTEGLYYAKESQYYLIYEESAVTGMEKTTTSVKAEDNKVILNRMGQTEFKQVFEEGLFNQGVYSTPYGKMVMVVRTSKVRVDLTDTGGSINLEYELEVGKEKVSDNTLHITVKEVN